VDRSEERPRVLPDACIDLVWDRAELQVAGPNTRPSMVPSQPTFVGIRFRPGAAPGLLGVPASDLLDQNGVLRDLSGKMAGELAERLADGDPADAPRLLEEAILVRRDASAADPDPVIPELLAHLSQRRGAAPGSSLLTERLGVSERTLRRRCVSGIAYERKMVDRVLRVRRAVRLVHTRMPLVAAAHLTGHADQTHLTRELQYLGGLTPCQLWYQPAVAISGNGSA
jgi:AraC-like DNA-binding protein